MSGILIYLLLVSSILLDGHSTFIGLKKRYKERNPFLLGLRPKAVFKTTFIMWAVLSSLFMLHQAAKRWGMGWYTDQNYDRLFLAIAIAKIIIALENYALVFIGTNIGSIMRKKPVKVLPEPLVDVVITLTIAALPAVLVANALIVHV